MGSTRSNWTQTVVDPLASVSSRFPHCAVSEVEVDVPKTKTKMACLVSTSFVVRLRASPLLLLNRGVHELDFALSRLSRNTAQKILGSCSSNKHILSVKGRGSCQHCFMSSARFLHDTYSYKGDADYCCTEIVISGYWVGPDADDGWGFVEAVIDQIP